MWLLEKGTIGTEMILHKMKIITVQNILLLFLVSNLFLSIYGSALAEGVASDQGIAFNWAFVANTGSGKSETLVPVTRDTVLQSGDQFKMMVALQNQCFVYVLFKTSDGEILKLFPENFDIYQRSDNIQQRKFYLPGEDSWFTLDENTGVEKVYLLASHNRLSELEKLLNTYAISEDKKQIAADIVLFIKKTRQQYGRFTISAERPVRIGGTFRNVEKKQSKLKNVDSFAINISGEDFFAKTFSIEHR